MPRTFSETAAPEAHSGEREKSGAGAAPSQLYRNLWEWAAHFPGDCQVGWLWDQWVRACFSKEGVSLGSGGSLPWELSEMQTRGPSSGGADSLNLQLPGRDQPSVCSWTLQVMLALAHWRTLGRVSAEGRADAFGFPSREGRKQTPFPKILDRKSVV